MSLTPEDSQAVASRLLGGAFKNFRKAAVFIQKTAVSYQSQGGTTKTQTVQMIRKGYKESEIKGDIKKGDFQLIGEYQHFKWAPSLDNTTVTYNGAQGVVRAVDVDSADAVMKIRVSLL